MNALFNGKRSVAASRDSAACVTVLLGLGLFLLVANPAFGFGHDSDFDFDFGALTIDDDSPDPLDMAIFHDSETGEVHIERYEDQTWQGTYEADSLLSLEFLEGSPSILIEGDIQAHEFDLMTRDNPDLDLTVTGSLSGEFFVPGGTATLRIGDGGETGTLDFNGFSGNMGTLELNRSDDVDFGSRDPTQGSFTVDTFRHAGTGTTTLTSPINVTGSTHIAAGTVVSPVDNMNFGNTMVEEGATLDMSETSGGSANLSSIRDGQIISGANELDFTGDVRPRESFEDRYVSVNLSEGGTLRFSGAHQEINLSTDSIVWELIFPGQGEIILDSTGHILSRNVDFGMNTVRNNTTFLGYAENTIISAENLINNGHITGRYITDVADAFSGSGTVTFQPRAAGAPTRLSAGHFTGTQSLNILSFELPEEINYQIPFIRGHFDNTGGIRASGDFQIANGSHIETEIELRGTTPSGSEVNTSLYFEGTPDSPVIVSGNIFGDGAGYVSSTNHTASDGYIILRLGDAHFKRGLFINRGTFQVGDFGMEGNLLADVELENGGRLDFARSDAHEFADQITGSGLVRQLGEGELLLSGDNSYSGQTEVEDGELRMGHVDALGTSSVAVHEGAVLDSGEHVFDLSRVVGSGDFQTTAGYFFNSAEDHTTGVKLSGDNALTKEGTGTLTLSGDNVFSGGTQIEEGTLRLGTADGAGSGDVEIAEGAVFDSDGFVFPLERVIGSGDFVTSADYVFSGDEDHVLNSGLSGENELIKRGEGRLTLARETAHTGGTVIEAGELELNAPEFLTPGISTQEEGALVLNFTENATFDRAVTGAGSLVHRGEGTTTLSGESTHTGGTVIEAGGLELTESGRIQGAVTAMENAGLILNWSGEKDFDLPLSGAGSLFHRGEGTTTLTGASSHTGGTFIEGGTVVLGHEMGAGAGPVEVAEGASFDAGEYGVDLSRMRGAGEFSSGSDHVFDGSEEHATELLLSGDVELLKRGGGRTVYTGAATHTGGTRIESGELQLGDGETLGTVAGDISIDEAGMLAMKLSEDFEFTNDTSGDGGFVKRGGGIVEMTGANNYRGVTRIEEGGLRVGPASYPSGMGVVEIWEGATFHASRGPVTQGLRGAGGVDIEGPRLWLDVFDGEETFSGDLIGDGVLNKRFEGSQRLEGEVVHTGATNIMGGRLEIPGGLETAGGLVAVSSGATFATGGTVARDVNNSGTVAAMSGEALTLSGDVSGTGRFEGDFVFAGTTRPGESPGLMEVEGDLAFGPEHYLEMELAGLSRGDEYDAFDITGDLNVDGTMEVVFLDAFEPEEGDTFSFFQVDGTIQGTFANMILPEFTDERLLWDTGALYETGTLGVIPEPRTYALLFGLAVLGMAVRKRLLRHWGD